MNEEISFFFSIKKKQDENILLYFRIKPKDTEILVGTNQWNSNSGGQRYKIESIYVHDNYGRAGLAANAGDIVLVHTETPIQFSKKVQPIKYSRKAVPVDANLQVFGK